MRILQIITLSELGGAQSVVVNLANKLSENNEVIVAAGEGDGKMFDLLKPSIKTERIPHLVRKLSPVNEVYSLFEMRKLYLKYKPDVVHLHSSKAGLLGRIAFPKNRTVYTVHGFDSIRIAYRKFLPFEKILQTRCGAIVGVSGYDERNLRSEGITHNVSTVYNGIYTPKGLQNDPFRELNRRHGVILCIARLSPQKKHELFVEVARKLPQYTFVWIGNQHNPDFEYPENAVFLGNIPDAASYIRYADLFMLPSNYEGLPMVIIESLASGVPVVASDVGGITELLNGVNGVALKNDASLFAKKISFIIGLEESERKAMSDNALKTYKDKFTVENMSKGYLHIYENLQYK